MPHKVRVENAEVIHHKGTLIKAALVTQKVFIAIVCLCITSCLLGPAETSLVGNGFYQKIYRKGIIHEAVRTELCYEKSGVIWPDVFGCSLTNGIAINDKTGVFLGTRYSKSSRTNEEWTRRTCTFAVIGGGVPVDITQGIIAKWCEKNGLNYRLASTEGNVVDLRYDGGDITALIHTPVWDRAVKRQEGQLIKLSWDEVAEMIRKAMNEGEKQKDPHLKAEYYLLTMGYRNPDK